MSLLRRFEDNTTFTEEEGWMLFRIAAVAEACGWTLLVSGIACERYITPGNRLPVLIAGQFHGILFLSYAVAAAGLYPTLGWSRKRAAVALLASIPPYGSLLFEWWARSVWRHSQFHAFACTIALVALAHE